MNLQESLVHFNAEKIYNLAIRLTTLSIRFLFIFFLAKYLDPASVGYYGLFTSAVSYSMYFVGLDFYIYTTREIIHTTRDRRGQMLKGQLALSAVLYVALLPIAIILLRYVGLPTHLILWFAPLLALELFNQEVYRLLSALSHQNFASMLLFMRQGSWGLMIVALLAWSTENRHLDAVMALWTLAGLFTSVLGILKLKRLQIGGWSLPIDVVWIRKGITLSATFLVATLALRGVQTIDRYWLESLGGIEVVGAYVLFLGMAGALMVFLDAGLFAFAYPELIRLVHEGDHMLVRKRMWQMLVQTLAMSTAFTLFSWFVLPILLNWIGNPVYSSAFYLYPWVLAAVIINALGMVPHYMLYAYGKDGPIIASHLTALPAFVLATWLVSTVHSLLAVPIGIVASFILILIWKAIACLRLYRDAVMASTAKSP